MKIVTCDIECYINYFLITIYSLDRQKAVYFEKFEDSEADIAKLKKILSSYTVVTFNGNRYDIPLIHMFLAGCSNKRLKKASDGLIDGSINCYDVISNWKQMRIDTIDIIDVLPLKATLKIYGGRIHTKTIQDLPIEPDAVIKAADLPLMRKYCCNDVKVTAELYNEIKFHIDIREMMGAQLNIDLRSKGDAKIAETMIVSKIEKSGASVDHAEIPAGTTYRYNPPSYIKFTSDILNEVLHIYKSGKYKVTNNGHIEFKFPDGKGYKEITIHNTKYRIGIGGIHSCEQSAAYYADNGMLICDNDVTSYYPNIVLNNRYYPDTLGQVFYDVYKSIVDERIAAKKSGNKLKAQALKIPINASFGKFGSKFSKMYAPNLVINVTLTGQLSLLMLIEKLEASGISVISANTDGIVSYYDSKLDGLKNDIVDRWCRITSFQMEATHYRILASRDVNNYVAVKLDNSCKGKGAYADLNDEYYKLRSNPSGAICYTAVREYLAHDVPLEKTIHECKDIRQFISIRTAEGGAVYAGKLIGKSLRYYHSTDSLECFFYSDKIKTTAGHKVPDTDGTVPCMVLPDKLPADIDYEYYVDKAIKALNELGVLYI